MENRGESGIGLVQDRDRWRVVVLAVLALGFFCQTTKMTCILLYARSLACNFTAPPNSFVLLKELDRKSIHIKLSRSILGWGISVINYILSIRSDWITISHITAMSWCLYVCEICGLWWRRVVIFMAVTLILLHFKQLQMSTTKGFCFLFPALYSYPSCTKFNYTCIGFIALTREEKCPSYARFL